MISMTRDYESKTARKARLQQYRKVGPKWQFSPVAKKKYGKPTPEQILIASEPTFWRCPGAKFHFDWLDAESGNTLLDMARNRES
jgi:hypothetical protein